MNALTANPARIDADAPPVVLGTPFGPSRNPGERGMRDPGRTHRRSSRTPSTRGTRAPKTISSRRAATSGPNGMLRESETNFEDETGLEPEDETRPRMVVQAVEASVSYLAGAKLPSLYVPVAITEDRAHPPQQITLLLRPTGDRERDKRRIKTLYGTLISYPGHDKFSFQIYEGGKGHLLDFPNDTTRVCPEMLARLRNLMGEESWRIEEITFQ